MIIESLKLKNYRNFENLSVNFNKHLNIIHGDNGQGKTNLIESLLFLSTTKSHRLNDDSLLINKNNDNCLINGEIKYKLINKNLRIIITKQGKSLIINKKNINKVSEFIGELNAVLFCPDDLNLFTQSPKYRRKFIDLELSKISKQYTSILNEYYKLLKNRNLYLKNEKLDLDYLAVLTDSMIKLEVIIINQRQKFIDELMIYANYYFNKFNDENLIISCFYETFIEKNIDIDYLKKIHDQALNKEIQLKQTLVGIHRDDFIFKIHNYDVDKYASQGQKRMILLAIKLGLVKMIHLLKDEYPILLLDDVFSELDQKKQEKLIQIIPNSVQTFITTCNKNIFNFNKSDIKYYEVADGKII